MRTSDASARPCEIDDLATNFCGVLPGHRCLLAECRKILATQVRFIRGRSACPGERFRSAIALALSLRWLRIDHLALSLQIGERLPDTWGAFWTRKPCCGRCPGHLWEKPLQTMLAIDASSTDASSTAGVPRQLRGRPQEAADCFEAHVWPPTAQRRYVPRLRETVSCQSQLAAHRSLSRNACP